MLAARKNHQSRGPLPATHFHLKPHPHVMGLMDFLNTEGDKKPVETTPAAGADASFGSTDASADTNTYTVASGDSLSKIAKNQYGDASKWHQIYEANKDLIGNNPDLIEVGQVLTIPSL